MVIKPIGGEEIVVGKKLVGYEANGGEILFYAWLEGGLEEYLLLFRTTRWQKFLAKHFGFRIRLGFFKKVGHADYMDWFLFWCDRCERFQVSYKRGFANRLDCESCLSKSYP